jgi:hypothetical protein
MVQMQVRQVLAENKPDQGHAGHQQQRVIRPAPPAAG